MQVREFAVKAIVQARFSDTDAMGHVNNARYISYMEEGRVAYFGRLFPDASWHDYLDRFPFIIADVQCAFKAPTFCGEFVEVSLGVTRLGTKSFDIAYHMSVPARKTTVAIGKTVQVMYDYRKGESYPMPPEIAKKLAALEGCSIAELTNPPA